MSQPVVLHKVHVILKDEYHDYAVVSFSRFASSKVETGILTSRQDLDPDTVMNSIVTLDQLDFHNVGATLLEKLVDFNPASNFTLNTQVVPTAIVTDLMSYAMYHNSLERDEYIIRYNANSVSDPEMEEFNLPMLPTLFSIVGANYTMLVYKLKPGVEVKRW